MKKTLILSLLLFTTVIFVACASPKETETSLSTETTVSTDSIEVTKVPEDVIPQSEPSAEINVVIEDPTFIEKAMEINPNIKILTTPATFTFEGFAFNGDSFDTKSTTTDFAYFDMPTSCSTSSIMKDGTKTITLDYVMDLSAWSLDYWHFAYQFTAFDIYTGNSYIVDKNILGQDEDKWSYNDATIATKDNKEVNIKLSEQIKLVNNDTEYNVHMVFEMPEDYDGLALILCKYDQSDEDSGSMPNMDGTKFFNDTRELFIIPIK